MSRHGWSGGGSVARREPYETVTLEAGKLILPHTVQFGARSDLPRGKEIHDVPRAHLGWSKVDGVLATIGKVTIAVAPRVGQGDGAEATKAKEVADVGGDFGEKEEGRLVATRRARQAVALARKVAVCRAKGWKVGGRLAAHKRTRAVENTMPHRRSMCEFCCGV